MNDTQFGFQPGRGTADAIFTLRRIQKKQLPIHKSLYFAFVDLEKSLTESLERFCVGYGETWH